MTEDTDATTLASGMLRRDPADPVRPGGAGAGDAAGGPADVVDLLRRIVEAWDASAGMARHMEVLTIDALITEARAILAQPAPSLDAAWARVEAALPDGWRYGIYRDPRDTDAVYRSWADDGSLPDRDEEEGDGPTPIAALSALADALEARRG